MCSDIKETMADLIQLKDSIVKGRLNDAVDLTRVALDEGTDPQVLITDYMITAMQEIGQKFQDKQAYVPELLMAARAMRGALNLVQPLLVGEKSVTIGKIVIGTVFGDLHDIGKHLVASMLEGCGFEVIDLGVNVSADAFVKAVQEHDADILALSALLTTTMNYMKTVIDAMDQSGLRPKVKIMVGGAPVNKLFADQIGADGYSANANEAVHCAKQLLNIQ